MTLTILSTAPVGFAQFLTDADYPTNATGLRGIVVFDMNGDGRPDVAAVNYATTGSSNNCSVLLNSGFGALGTATQYTTQTNSEGFASADVNGDGRQDLVFVHSNTSFTGGYTVLLGNSNGTYSAGPAPAAPLTMSPLSLMPILADFTADGKTDLAALVGGDDIVFRTGAGNGNFNLPGNVDIDIPAGPSAFAAADMDLDGKLDLLVASSTNNQVSYFRRDGGVDKYNFDHPVHYSVGAGPTFVLATDLDADGKPDVIVLTPGSFNMSVFKNSGTGSLTAVPNTQTVYGNSVVASDFDHDGKKDLAVNSQFNGASNVLYGDGACGFVASASVNLGGAGANYTLHAADLNNDTELDLVMGNSANKVYVSLGSPLTALVNGPVYFPAAKFESGATGPYCVLTQDFDNDGKPDVLTGHRDAKAVSFGKGMGRDGMGSPILTQFAAEILSIAGGDLNGDGKRDLAVTQSSTSSVAIVLGNGTGQFPTAKPNVNVGDGSSHPRSVKLADINHDNKLDVITANGQANSVTVALGVGDGTFGTPLTEPSVGTDVRTCELADFNLDGDLDVATANLASDNATILFGNGSGGFTAAPKLTVATGNNPYSTVFLNVNADGKPDLAVACNLDNKISLYLGDGAGNVQGAAIDLTDVDKPRSLAAADLNGDGADDVVASDEAKKSVKVFLKDPGGSGYLTPRTYPAFPDSPSGPEIGQGLIAITDFDGDFDLDIVTAHGATTKKNVSFLFNLGTGTFGNTESTVNGAPKAVALGDLNLDSRLDFAVAPQGGNIELFMNAGSKFTQTTSPSFGSNPLDLAIADLDLDGVLDMAVSFDNNPDRVAILQGSVNGLTYSLTLAGTYPVSKPRRITVGDWNADGKPDLAVASIGTYSVAILRNLGGLAFTAQSAVPVGAIPTAIAQGDFNLDGKRDLAVTCQEANLVFALVGDGAGSFGPSTSKNLSVQDPKEILARDVDHDGNPDWIVTSPALNRVNTFLLTDLTTFKALKTANFAYPPDAIALIDSNNDQNLDLIMTLGGFFFDRAMLLLGDGKGGYKTSTEFSVGAKAVSIAAGNIDAIDTITDVVIANEGSQSVSIINGIGNNLFDSNTGSTACGSAQPKAGATGDLDKNGRKDTAAVNRDSNTLTVELNVAPNPPICKGPYPTGSLPSAVAMGYVNGDTHLDVVVANNGSGDVTVYLGDGFGNLSIFGFFACGPTPSDLSLGDVNNDGSLDITVTNDLAGSTVTTLLGNNNGTFGAGQTTTPGVGHVSSFDLGDLDADGFLDLALADFDGADAVALDNQSSGSSVVWVASATLAVGNGPIDIHAGDLDSDGRLDILVANSQSNSVSVHLAHGTGFTYGSVVHYAAGVAPVGLAIADLNGDGPPDFACANAVSNSVSVFLGDGSGGVNSSFSIDLTPFGSGAPASLVADDVNNDLRIDLIVPRGQGGTSAITVIENVSSYAPGVTPYGAGTAGCSGPHSIGVNSPPRIDNPGFAILCTNAPSLSLGLGLVTDSSSVGGDPFAIGVNFLVDFFAATEVLTFDFLSNKDGAAVAVAAIPNSPVLVGKHYFAQGLFVWVGPCVPSTFGLSTSNGLDLEIQP